MSMLVHELHPTLVHAPLSLLPATAAVDLAAAIRRDKRLSRLGGTLWASTAGAGLLAGLAGMAASQEIRLEEKDTRDMMFLHGIGNVTLVAAAAGMALWRRGHRASLGSAITGFLATGFALYTGWLGGELVYDHGAGVKMLRGAQGEPQAPRLFSREAPARLGRDALLGLRWLMSKAGNVLSGRETIEPRALGIEGAEQRAAAELH